MPYKAPTFTPTTNAENFTTHGDPVAHIPTTGSNTCKSVAVDGFTEEARLIYGTYIHPGPK